MFVVLLFLFSTVWRLSDWFDCCGGCWCWDFVCAGNSHVMVCTVVDDVELFVGFRGGDRVLAGG